MPAFIPLHTREMQINAIAISNSYTFVKWVDNYTGCFSRIVVRCPYHGEWCVTVTNFVNRKTKCMKCVTGTGVERATQLSTIASARGYRFVGFVGEYKNKYGEAIFECSTHGTWSGIIGNFVNTDAECPKCASVIPQLERELQILSITLYEGYRFVGWVKGYIDCKSKAFIECPTHGIWAVGAIDFISKGNRCPGCAMGGYSPFRCGTLYALLSECGMMVKIGISNVPRDRHTNLKRRTPFKFSVHRQLHCEDGSHPPMLERLFHDVFPSVGLSGFDGATEWRMWHDDVNTWFDLLGG